MSNLTNWLKFFMRLFCNELDGCRGLTGLRALKLLKKTANAGYVYVKTRGTVVTAL